MAEANADATLTIDVEARRAINELRQLVDAGKKTEGQFDKTEKKTRKLATGFAALKRNVAGLGVGLSAGLIGRSVIRHTVEAQNAIAQLGAVLESTGGVAGQTMESLEAMAAELQRTTTYGDEATKSAQAMLLTFKKIRGEAFEPALRATLDLATAMGTDLKSAALQVGKALEDPATQMTYLRRSGVSFTAEQVELAKQLQATGRLAEAQAMVLRELETQFGGSAEAARNTLGGALEYLKNQWGDAMELSTTGSQGMVDAINAIGEAIPRVREKIDGFVAGIQKAAAVSSIWFMEAGRLAAFLKGGGRASWEKNTEEIERHLVALNEVLMEIDGVGEASEAAATSTTDLTTVVEDQAEAAKQAAEEWQKFLDVLKDVQEQQERFGAGVYARRAMRPIGEGVPTLGGGPVTANLSIASGQQAYAEYEAWIRRVTEALDDGSYSAATAFQGVTSLADSLGILDTGARQALQGLSSLINGLMAGGPGGLVGVLGGITSILSGLFGGGGKSDAEIAREQQLEAARLAVEAQKEQLKAVQRFDNAVERFRAYTGGPKDALALAMQAQREARGADRTTTGPRILQRIGDEWQWVETGLTVLEEYAKKLVEITENFRDELEVRRLLALGMDEEAEALRLRIQQEAEYAAAVAAGFDEVSLAMLKHVQELEVLAIAEAKAREEEEKRNQAIKEAIEQREREIEAIEQANRALEDDLAVRGLYARGLDDEAQIMRKQIEMEKELAAAREAGVDQALIDRLKEIGELELKNLIEELKGTEADISTPRVSRGRYSDWPVTLSEVTGQSLNALQFSQLSWLRVIAANTGRTAMNTSSLASGAAIDAMLGTNVTKQEQYAGRSIV